jgi:putative membrane protein
MNTDRIMKYTRFSEGEMSLRDHLAKDRTELANERTLLAYARTWIALVAAGAGIMEIFGRSAVITSTGCVFMCAGFAVLAVGITRFFANLKQMRSVSRAAAEPARNT